MLEVDLSKSYSYDTFIGRDEERLWSKESIGPWEIDPWIKLGKTYGVC